MRARDRHRASGLCAERRAPSERAADDEPAEAVTDQMNPGGTTGCERPQCLMRQLGGHRLRIHREGVVGQADDVPEAAPGERTAQRRPDGLTRGVAVYEQHGAAGVAPGDMLDAPALALPHRVRKLQGRHPHGLPCLLCRHVYAVARQVRLILLDPGIAASRAAACRFKQQPVDQPLPGFDLERKLAAESAQIRAYAVYLSAPCGLRMGRASRLAGEAHAEHFLIWRHHAGCR
jgi:hypothetical protein